MSPVPLHQPDGMITQVREACGAGRDRINGICVARTTKRKSAGARCGVQGTSAVSGYIETLPEQLVKEGLVLCQPL